MLSLLWWASLWAGAPPVITPPPSGGSAGGEVTHPSLGVVDGLIGWTTLGGLDGLILMAPIFGAGDDMALLDEKVASNSTSLAFTGKITSAYPGYLIELVNLVPDSNIDYLCLQVSTDNGATWDTASVQRAAHTFAVNNSSSNYAFNQNNGTMMPLADRVAQAPSAGLSGAVRLYNPLGTTSYKQFTVSAAWAGTSPLMTGAGGCVWENLAAYTAVRLLFTGSPTTKIASGIARLYGLKGS